MAYDVAGDKNYKLLPNIIKRVKLRSGLRSGSFLFDEYDVKDGERYANFNSDNLIKLLDKKDDEK